VAPKTAAKMAAIERRADAIAAAQESVAALGRARGQEGLRAAIAGVHAMARLTLTLTRVNPIEG